MLAPDQEKRVLAVLSVVEDHDDDGFYEHTKALIGPCSSLELHLIAGQWNWDAGWGALQAVAEHPRCDAATALLIFWHGQPGTYLDDWMLAADADEMDVEHRDLLVAIQERYARNGFVRSGIAFDPTPLIEPDKQQNILPCMHEKFGGPDLSAIIARIRQELHRTGQGL